MVAAQALKEGAQDYLIKGQVEARGLVAGHAPCQRAQRLERLKDEFIASVSHELRTPLTSIAGSLGLLMGSAADKLPGPAVRLLEIAHSNSQRLVRLVKIFWISRRWNPARVVFNVTRMGVQSLVEEAIEANQGFGESNDVRIRIEDPRDVGDARADSDRLIQVVTNLLSNAIKFSPPGNMTLSSQ